ISRAEAQESTPTGPSAPRSPLSVPADDPRITGEDITFHGTDATIMAYQARPSGAATGTPGATTAASPVANGKLPVVLVCHENRALTDQTKAVARRWAVGGYVACAVDLLSREGGTAGIADQSQIPSLLSPDNKRPQQVGDFQAAVEHYKTQDFVD